MADTDEDVGKMIDAAPPQVRQTVWKDFEYSRVKEGGDKAMSKAFSTASGSGANAKKKMLLISWLRDGQKIGACCAKAFHSLAMTTSSTQKLEWLTFNEVVTKYGKAEAKARILSGSLVSKADPSDSRFFLFLAKSEIMVLAFALGKIHYG
jgi:hypothetical protein